MPKLTWFTWKDDNGNTIHEAPGFFTNENGAPFYYLVHALIKNNSLRWTTQGTDKELIPLDKHKCYDTMASAMAACQSFDDEHRATIKENGHV